MPERDKVTGPVDDVLRPLITRIRVQASYLPDPLVDIKDPFGPSTGKVDRITAALKPKVTFDTPGGAIVIAPGGEPDPTRWPLVKGGMLLLGGFGILGIVILARK